MYSERLCKQGAEREECENEHRPHPSCIRVHALFLHKNLWQVSATDRNDGHDSIEGEDKRLSEETGRRGIELVAEIRRRPEKEEPPDTVSEEFAHDKCPGLAVSEALGEGDGRFALGSFSRCSLFGGLCGVILMYVFKFGSVDVLAVFRLVVHKLPEEHPDKAEGTDDDECPFPTERAGERRYRQRCGKCAYGRAGIEN